MTWWLLVALALVFNVGGVSVADGRRRRMTFVADDLWDEIGLERDRQDEKWGGVPGVQRHDDHTYAAVLGEEFGEVCKAWLERDLTALREELVQTAAVAIAWIEELDNAGVPRP